jgi:amino acid adenylation domain-containing protein
VAAGDLAYVFFTSGTTGVPKGVPITHSNVLAYLNGLRSLASVTPDARVMQVVDLTFDLSVHDIFVAWTSGACLYSIPENGTLLASRFVEEHEGTHWLSVPSAAALVKQSGLLTAGCMPSLRYSFFCGEALPGRVAESWAAAAPNSAILNIYGPTEATIAFTAYRYEPGQAEPPAVVSLGEPYPGQEVGLFDEARMRVLDGTGEICLSGTQVSQGYWNAPDITAERFFEAEGKRWYRTGDLGRYVPGEGYAYLGRVDRQVKIRGYRVELQEIETAICKVVGCDMAAVIPWPLDDSGAALGCVGYILGETVADEATERLKALLPDYMIPSRITALAEMPLNANGKIDHRAIAALLTAPDNGTQDA